MFGTIDLIGGASGIFIAWGIYVGGGWPMLALLFTFFALGSLATRWKITRKGKAGLAEPKRGKRSAVNAFSNAGVAALTGFLAWWSGSDAPVLEIMMAGSLASATSDTLSSELGNLYGSRYVDVLTLRSGERGKDGVISPEGTLAGLLGSASAAWVFFLTNSDTAGFLIVTFAGILGNISDSIFGATLQRRGILNNHGVNLVSTLLAALLAGGMALIG